MSDDLTTRLAQVLDKHHRFGRVGCLCGTPFKANVLDDAAIIAEHEAHQAVVLATEVAAWLTSDEVRAAHRDAYAGGRHLGVCLAAIADLARGGE